MAAHVARAVERFHNPRPDLARDVVATRQGLVAYVRLGSLASLLTAPVVYSLLFPLAVLDVWVSVYQLVCFPVYGIPRVGRRAHIAMDRETLPYLNAIERIHCTFCSYANGVISYVREVAALTEQYWCPIKHARNMPAPHSQYASFVDFGDAEGYRR